MDDVADRLDQASDSLTALSRDIPTLSVAPGAFAADAQPASNGPADQGLPRLVGRALHDHWAAMLEARSHEASSAAARLSEMARSVRATRRHYAATDEAVEHRFQQEL